MYLKQLLTLSVGLTLIAGCDEDEKIKGCTDVNSISYNAQAEEDDGSCLYGGVAAHESMDLLPGGENLIEV